MSRPRSPSGSVFLSLALSFGLSLLGGQARGAAPSFEAFGAFFPAWLLCASAGIAGAIAARVVMVRGAPAAVLPFQLLVCTAAGSIIATLVWLLFFA